MSKLLIYVRSFHPLTNFGVGGLGYHGDDRGFSWDTDRSKTTTRIFGIAEIDLVSASVRPVQVGSDPSSGLTGILTDDYSNPERGPKFTQMSGSVDPYREDGDQGGQLVMAYTGQNFAQPLAGWKWLRDNVWAHVVPALDVTTSLSFEVDRDDNRMSCALRMVGDGFPNAEAFLLDASEAPLMLASHRRVGSALHQLRNNRRIAMCSTGLELDFEADAFGSALEPFWCLDYATFNGTQIDVMEETGVSPSTRSEWNSMHTERDAEGGWGRYAVGDTLPTFVPGRSGSSMP